MVNMCETSIVEYLMVDEKKKEMVCKMIGFMGSKSGSNY